MRFNIEDYKGKYVMHCKTEEEAKIFCEYLHSIGHKWINDISYLSKNYWDTYEESTCYNFNRDQYCNKEYFEEKGYTFLEMEDFIDKEEDEPNNSDKNGIDHTEDVFKLLGLSPDEVFKVGSLCSGNYKITQDLRVYTNVDREHWIMSVYTIADFLNGTLKIYKKPVPTEIEQLAIDYALACGCHWFAKDKDGTIYAYMEEPTKYKKVGRWHPNKPCFSGEVFEIGLPISFLSWDDEEPYYIGD